MNELISNHEEKQMKIKQQFYNQVRELHQIINVLDMKDDTNNLNNADKLKLLSNY
ncbi:hypothetical protein pb186bvf_020323 [Paramecium bursaria]